MTGILPFVVPGLFAMIFQYAETRKIILKNKQNVEIENIGSSSDEEFEKNKKFISYVIVIGILVFLQNIDIIIVKFLFPVEQVALYAAVSVIVKFILIFIGIIETITIPVLVDESNDDLKRKYTQAILGLGCIGSLLCIFLMPFLGDFTLSVM